MQNLQHIKVTFIGTGTSQGIPVVGCRCKVCKSVNEKDNRLRTSVLVESSDTRLVIDTGPDFRQQLLKSKIQTLDAVLFTHEHKDHIAGLDEVRAFNYLQKTRMPVYATTRVQSAIKREFAYIFSDEKYPGVPEIDLYEFDKLPFTVGDIRIEPIDVMHHQLPVKAFKIGNFGYVTDANFISEGEKEKLKNCTVLVVNALRREEHISHFTLQQALDLIAELKPTKAYLTHISHQLGTHEDVSIELPANVELAFDSLQIIV
jgi:phosphoribosyl 1,2-cyclic phosphate phosphodiesterase